MRRPDWLTELHGFLALAAIGTGAAGVVTTVGTLTGQPVEIEVPADSVIAGAPPGLSPGPAVPLLIDAPTAAQTGWALLAALPRFVLVTAVLVLLWRAVGRARHDDDLFRTGLAGRLHTLGLLLTVGGLVTWAVEAGARLALSDSLGTAGTYWTADLSTPVWWGLLGFGMFAIGQIVRRGQAMRDDLDRVV
ncbi:MAG TPA: hypothetical protein VN408_24420 [Actinoplanes sp.]|nr:hypothetical protein [Actinoplanes sp.]